MLRLLLAPLAAAQAQQQAGRAALVACSSSSSSGVLQQQLGFSTAAAPGAPPAAPPQPTITAPTVLGRKPQDWSLAMQKAAEIGAQSVTKASDKEIGYCTGIPTETYNRMARIYSPARTASQSGLARTNHNSAPAPAWKIAFETTGKWENPLIGWTSTADPLENVGRASLFFYTKEQAIDFCKKHGWNFAVEDPNPRRTDRQKRYAAYGDNFSVKRKGLPDLSHLPSNKK